MPPTKLSKCIVSPQRLVNILDWKKRKGCVVMSLDITEERIGLAFAKHPSRTNTVHALEPIKYMSGLIPVKRMNRNLVVKNELERVIKKHQACAFVVAWPLQPDGRMGKQCGKVLHLLDYFADASPPLVSKDKSFVLWDARDVPRNNLEVAIMKDRALPADKWGRSEIFSRIPSISITEYSSREQFHHPSTKGSLGAKLILKDFMDTHWEPEEVDEFEDECIADYHNFNHAVDAVDYEEYEEKGVYIQPNLL